MDAARLRELSRMDSQLLKSAVTGDTERIQQLLLAGADVNTRDHFGETPLMKAVRNGHHECIDFLVQAGADVNTVNTDECAALMIATAS